MDRLATALKQINDCSSRRTLWHLMLDFFHGEGVKMASYHAAKRDGTSGNIFVDGFPDDWVCHYLEADLVQIDPIPALAAKLSRPFHWHEIENLAEDRKRSHMFLEELKSYGIGDGLAFYVFGPGTRNAYVGLGFGVDHIELPSDRIFEMQCVAQAGHLRVCALNDLDMSAPKLTPREAEVLDWVSRGKSNAVIAEILGVSTHTVDTLLRRIYAKLNVTDRTTAAIRGVGSGIIHLT